VIGRTANRENISSAGHGVLRKHSPLLWGEGGERSEPGEGFLGSLDLALPRRCASDPSPGPRRLVKTPVSVHPLPSGEGKDPVPCQGVNALGPQTTQRYRLYVECLIVVFLLLGCTWVSGGTVENRSTDLLEQYVRQFESSYHAVQTISADFTQTYVSGGRTRIESGVVYFARGGLMRWDYERPQPKLFLSDGKTLVLYIPEEKQLIRSPLKASDDIRIPFRLLLSRLNFRRVFSRIELAPDATEHDPADHVLRAYPKKEYEGDYQQVLMVVSPQFDIRRLLVILPDQSTMDFSFDHIGRDVPLSRSLFRFTPPPGTEVIDQR
jgi:outer membrane lipoprotein carrier protein